MPRSVLVRSRPEGHRAFFIDMGYCRADDKQCPGRYDVPLRERIDEWGRKDPSFIKKALIAYVFHESVIDIQDRFSAEDIDKWSDAALYVIDSVIFAPFKNKR